MKRKNYRTYSNSKFTYLMILGVISSLCSQAQEYKKYFLGTNFEGYKGVMMKYEPEQTSDLAYLFYSSLPTMYSISGSVAFPSKAYNFVTEKDSLINKVFVVENVTNNNNIELRKIADLYGSGGDVFLHLRESTSNKLIYYRYNYKNDYSFPFVISGFKIDESKLSSELTKEIDDFTGKITISSPLEDGYNINDVSIYKFINKGAITYYLYLNAYASTLNVNKKGVIILFKDGTRLNKPLAEVDVDYFSADRGYRYSSFLPLTQNDLLMLRTKIISKYRLYIHDNELDLYSAEKIRVYSKSIVNKK